MKEPNTKKEQQQTLLDEAMSQPGVATVLQAYGQIEAAYLGATAAMTTTPSVVTTNTAR